MTSAKDVIDRLGQLDPDGIAQLFKDTGITGVQGDTCCCAVANYVRAETGWRRVYLNKLSAIVDTGRGKYYLSLPSSVTGFIHRFDEGMYPDLITPSQE